jgi:hypothetical protein
MRSIFLSAIFVILISCGGGDESGDYAYTPPTYGAIAINTIDGSAGISANYSYQSEANNKALSICGANCNTILEFGSYKCGALARASNSITFGWSSNNKKSNAESNAVLQCTQSNGVGCSVILSQCNSS